ncbi:unnamed protein product [Caretta caretta]
MTMVYAFLYEAVLVAWKLIETSMTKRGRPENVRISVVAPELREDFTTLQEVPAIQPGGDTESVNYWPWGEFVAGGRSWLDSWIPMSSIHQKNGSTSRS